MARAGGWTLYECTCDQQMTGFGLVPNNKPMIAFSWKSNDWVQVEAIRKTVNAKGFKVYMYNMSGQMTVDDYGSGEKWDDQWHTKAKNAKMVVVFKTKNYVAKPSKALQGEATTASKNKSLVISDVSNAAACANTILAQYKKFYG